MVSINISTSLQGTSKADEAVNEANSSGLENIFASMLSVVEDENSLRKSDSGNGSKGSEDTMLLLEEIKRKLGLNAPNLALDESKVSRGNLSENILQIYETYKTLIDSTLNIEKDATVTFDVEKVLKPQSDQGQASLVKNMESTVPSESSKLDITKLTIASEDLLLEESIEKFSELEMQRIRNSMKNDPQVNLEVGKLSKKTKSVKTDKLSQVQPALANQEDGKVTLPRSKASPLLEQGKLDSIQFSTTPENSRIESSLDQGQASIKSAANKLNSSELNAQGNQNAYETQLKLLEKNWGKALAKIIEKAIISGKEKIDISLDPQKLGKLHLTLSVVNNQTSIFINTETAAASLILSSAEDKLAQMFESSGYKLSNFQANSNGNNNSSRNGSEAKKIKLERDTGHKNELESVPSEEDSKLYSIDGRKIINIIA